MMKRTMDSSLRLKYIMDGIRSVSFGEFKYLVRYWRAMVVCLKHPSKSPFSNVVVSAVKLDFSLCNITYLILRYFFFHHLRGSRVYFLLPLATTCRLCMQTSEGKFWCTRLSNLSIVYPWFRQPKNQEAITFNKQFTIAIPLHKGTVMVLRGDDPNKLASSISMNFFWSMKYFAASKFFTSSSCYLFIDITYPLCAGNPVDVTYSTLLTFEYFL